MIFVNNSSIVRSVGIGDKNNYFEDEHAFVDAANGSCNVVAVTKIK